jgi:hypothetical protein
MSHVNTGQPLPAEKRRLILEAFDRLGSFTAVERETGIRRRTVRRYVQARERGEMRREDVMPPIVAELLNARGPTPPAAETARDYVHKEEGDSAHVEYTSDKRICTLEDALEYAEVDLAVWRVDRWEVVSWEVGMKLRSFDRGKVTHEQPVKKNLWRVKLYLKRIMSKSLQLATEAVFARMESHAPSYPKPPTRMQPRRPHMLEIDIFDAHFGKLAWSEECGPGQNYDLRTAEMLYRNAVDDLLALAAGFEIERFLLPIGNDFFHIDSLRNQTTAGTQVDTDGRYAKIIEIGEMAVIWAVERLATLAPVDVLWCPGNHDRLSSFHMARTLKAWFRSIPDVTVDCSPKVRKYHRYGTTLIGFEHGDKVKHEKLAGLMPLEMPHDFAETTTREFHVGHQHRARKLEFASLDTHGGIPVRVLRSLSAVDQWHFENAFVGSLRAAEAYLFSKETGYSGHFVANARLGG